MTTFAGVLIRTKEPMPAPPGEERPNALAEMPWYVAGHGTWTARQDQARVFGDEDGSAAMALLCAMHPDIECAFVLLEGGPR